MLDFQSQGRNIRHFQNQSSNLNFSNTRLVFIIKYGQIWHWKISATPFFLKSTPRRTKTCSNFRAAVVKRVFGGDFRVPVDAFRSKFHNVCKLLICIMVKGGVQDESS